MIQLHFYPSTASMAPHIVLEELAVPFELIKIDKDNDGLNSPAYRALNPNGLIPVLVDGDTVLYETAAICLHLADTHLEADLAPRLGSTERAHFYKWLSWLSTTLQQTLIIYFYPERWANDGEAVAQIKQHAQRKVLTLLEQIDAQLARHGQDWLLGTEYSLVDPYAMMLCRWTRNFEGPKARDYRHIGPWLQRVLARPAVQKVLATEQLAKPWV
ncbi:glutathione S-transferase family protein [Chitinimonas sp. BJB300]|uniref:glutathione S-transferase family protein n=1 Tax=Chitinimonas sp. BJB300 TaxID=1559339 RepID=UPI000C108255|nr:glutathione S-transferase family protein [Chitinimonas sp. BJB300]PHV10830.1 glutathione S-transferase [Chitinimonas sp. BJB300]TSJ87058.1 glutathione S-transferase family protein [Chitinimonas sp. BJB300]